MKKMPPMSPSMLLLIEELFSPEWYRLEDQDNNNLSTEKEITGPGTDELKISESEEPPKREYKLRLVKTVKKRNK